MFRDRLSSPHRLYWAMARAKGGGTGSGTDSSTGAPGEAIPRDSVLHVLH